jgi:hypothetical protein
MSTIEPNGINRSTSIRPYASDVPVLDPVVLSVVDTVLVPDVVPDDEMLLLTELLCVVVRLIVADELAVLDTVELIDDDMVDDAVDEGELVAEELTEVDPVDEPDDEPDVLGEDVTDELKLDVIVVLAVLDTVDVSVLDGVDDPVEV